MMRARTAILRLVLVGLAGVLVLPLVVGVLALRGPPSGAGADDGGPSVIATITTGLGGRSPQGVAVDPNTNRIYVANSGSNNVSVIDGASNTVVATVAVGSNPRGVAVNPTTNHIYVTDNFSSNVSVIDGASNTVVATVAVGMSPQGVAVNPNTNRIYVANWGDDTVSVIEDNSFLRGDVNGDGQVSMVDAMLIAQYVAGLIGSGALHLTAADVNCSGGVSMVDAMLVAQKVAGLISEFPACGP